MYCKGQNYVHSKGGLSSNSYYVSYLFIFSPGRVRLRASAGPLHGHHEEQGPGVRGAARKGLWNKGTDIIVYM